MIIVKHYVGERGLCPCEGLVWSRGRGWLVGMSVGWEQTRGPCTPGVTEKYAGNGVFEDARVLNSWKVCVIYITEMDVFGLKIGNFS